MANPVIATDQADPHDPSKGIDPAKQAAVTIDAQPPQSLVAALPAVETAPSFMVSWSGTDPGGPGIASYNIYVSINNGPSGSALARAATNTSSLFTGQNGSHLRVLQHRHRPRRTGPTDARSGPNHPGFPRPRSSSASP